MRIVTYAVNGPAVFLDTLGATRLRYRCRREFFLVDLHLHTTYSDGQLTPSELVQRAKEANLHSICITDHDTLAGYPEGVAAGKALGIEVLAGCEISCDHEGREIHILGLLVDPGNRAFQEKLLAFRTERLRHLPRILARLAELGVSLTEAEVRKLASDEFVGRPHIARAMIARGYVRDLDQAFDEFLGANAPAYLPRKRVSSAECIALIRGVGGVPVIAHPGVYHYGDREIGSLQELGLAGVEVLHPDHDEGLRTRYAEIARRRGLLLTGGSDFHGGERWKSRIQPGSMGVPDSLLEAVRSASRPV
jgi:predicted metal-dependent phosphoesterase TrpH